MAHGNLSRLWPFSGPRPELGRPAEAPTLQQAQNFQQSSSSSPRSRMRKMSRGMSQRKVPGGHSARDSKVTPGCGECGECGEAGTQGRGRTALLSGGCSGPGELGKFSWGSQWKVLLGGAAPPLSGWASPPARSLLTSPSLHADGGVGEDAGVSLQAVVVRAIVLLVLEGAVLAGLLCTQRGPGKARGAAPHGHTRAEPARDTPHAPAPSPPASLGTFLQLLHHPDVQAARAAVPLGAARAPRLAANAVADALAHSLEALRTAARRDGQGEPNKGGRTSPPQAERGGTRARHQPAFGW